MDSLSFSGRRVQVLRFLLVFSVILGVYAEVSAGSHAVDIHLQTATGTLRGTLQLPEAAGETAAVALIIAGSGPTDRDGNTVGLPGRNNSLKMLAEELARAGYASVRYDKRGIGASHRAALDESQLRLDTYVQDAASWMEMLAADSRFDCVVVIGHSEGALIGILAAQQQPHCARVTLASPSGSAADLLRHQLSGLLPTELERAAAAIIRSLEMGETVPVVPQELALLFRESVQPYLTSWFRYQPAEELQKLSTPVAIFHGQTDMQVPVAEAQALQAANPDARLHVIPGMNHILKLVEDDPQAQRISYENPDVALAPELVRQLVNFLNEALVPAEELP